MMVWWCGRVSSGGHADLNFIQNGALIAHRYLKVILQLIALPYADTVVEKLLGMDDNALPHRPSLTTDWKKWESRKSTLLLPPGKIALELVWTSYNAVMFSFLFKNVAANIKTY